MPNTAAMLEDSIIEQERLEAAMRKALGLLDGIYLDRLDFTVRQRIISAKEALR